MRPFVTTLQYKIIFILAVFISSFTTSFAQDVQNVDGAKTIVWSKIEDGFKVELIRENDHEYILKTPLEIIEGQTSEDPNLLFSTLDNRREYLIPELQNDELIKSRLYYLNSGMNLTFNAAVRREVDRLLVNRAAIESTLGRSRYILPISENVLAQTNVPYILKYLPLVESGYKPFAKSRVGARGIWQFMTSTARMYDLKVNRTTDQRLDPEKATFAAMTYLNDLYELFDDWELALAAYNCGPGRVQRTIRTSGLENPTFWDIDHLLPKETRNYIPKFIAAVYVMEHVNQIGLLADIEGYNQVKEQVEALQKSDFAQTSSYFATGSSIPENSTIVTYTVKSGDNLGFIAEWYDVRASELRGWNGISGNLIKAGQILNVYVPQQNAHIYEGIDKLTFAQKQDENPNNNGNSPQTTVIASQVDSNNYRIYKIKKGDTLWDISRKNGVSINEIKQLNNISNTQNLKPGMVIKISEKS